MSDSYFSHSKPRPFQCSVTPRSEQAARLVQSIIDEVPPDDGDSKADRETLQGLQD